MAEWLAEVQCERLGAQTDLMATNPRDPLSKAEVRGWSWRPVISPR